MGLAGLRGGGGCSQPGTRGRRGTVVRGQQAGGLGDCPLSKEQTGRSHAWRMWARGHPFPDGVPGGSPSLLLPPPPPSSWRKSQKLLLFTPHLPPKLLNFIPRTNKSIFIAAGGAGGGWSFSFFIFQSPVKSARISRAAEAPAGRPPGQFRGFLLRHSGRRRPTRPTGLRTCHHPQVAPRRPARSWGLPAASCLLGILSFLNTSCTVPPEARPSLPLRLTRGKRKLRESGGEPSSWGGGGSERGGL